MGMKAERISTYLNSQKVARSPWTHPKAPSLYLGLNTSTPQPDPNSLLQP